LCLLQDVTSQVLELQKLTVQAHQERNATSHQLKMFSEDLQSAKLEGAKLQTTVSELQNLTAKMYNELNDPSKGLSQKIQSLDKELQADKSKAIELESVTSQLQRMTSLLQSDVASVLTRIHLLESGSEYGKDSTIGLILSLGFVITLQLVTYTY
jgi:chromosome segregation ATPase